MESIQKLKQHHHILTDKINRFRSLAFIGIKMEVHWRSNPIGKVCKNLLFMEILLIKNLHRVIESTFEP